MSLSKRPALSKSEGWLPAALLFLKRCYLALGFLAAGCAPANGANIETDMRAWAAAQAAYATANSQTAPDELRTVSIENMRDWIETHTPYSQQNIDFSGEPGLAAGGGNNEVWSSAFTPRYETGSREFAVHVRPDDVRPLFLTASGLTPYPGAGFADARRLVEDIVLNDHAGDFELSGFRDSIQADDASLRAWGKPVAPPWRRFWLFFIDDAPPANWTHPCRYVFVAQDLSAVAVLYGRAPLALELRNGSGFRRVELEILLPYAPPPREFIEKTDNALLLGAGARGIGYSGDASNCYAVILSGGADKFNNHKRYWGDSALIYSTLIKKYGYPKGNIFALISDGTDPAVDRSDGVSSPTDLDGDGIADTYGPCLLGQVSNVFAHLAATLAADDQLFVFTTDHGSQALGQHTYINLWNWEELHDYDLESMTTNLPCPVMFVMEQCHSGGFVDNLGQSNRVITTAAAFDESSYAGNTYPDYDQYAYYWTAAVRGFSPGANPWDDGAPCNADANGDGYVSFQEASAYALTNKYPDDNPQYNSNPADLGARLFMIIMDTNAPSPNPMTWAAPPYALGQTSITMTATTAIDADGVEYYFEETSGNPGGSDSGWQAGAVYTDIGLAVGTLYSYRVKARDKSANRNETEWSTQSSATTDPPDNSPPSPDPMTWATAPHAIDQAAAIMTATTASDINGVEYYFEETSGNPGGSNSGWQAGAVYLNAGLAAGTMYSYRVKARDKSVERNETAWSASVSAITDSAFNTNAPSPNPMTWAALPYALGQTSITMTATTAIDADGVEYYFDETSGNPGGSDSGWQAGAIYTDIGLTAGATYTYRVKARDKSTNRFETLFSEPCSASTALLETPGGLTASDGVYPGYVEISWNAVPGAASYEVWRGAQDNRDSAARVAEVAGTAWNDTDVSRGRPWYYWVRAKNNSGTSVFSASDPGRRRFLAAGYGSGAISDLAVFDRDTGRWYIAALNTEWRVAGGEWRKGDGVQSSVSSIQTLKSPDTENRSPIASPHPLNTEHWTLNTDALRVIAWGAAWGWPGAEPVPGDYDGDGASDLAVFDRNTGLWYIAALNTEWRVASGEWRKGDGVQSSVSSIQTLKSPDTENRSPIASPRPHPPITDNRTPTTDALRVIAWGAAWGWPGAEPVPGDYDGDGASDLAVFDQNSGCWYIAALNTEWRVASGEWREWDGVQSSVSSIQTLKSPDTENRSPIASPHPHPPITDNRTPTTDALRVIAWGAAWGWPGAEPVPGDYDGDGASDLAVFDQNSGLWYIASLTSVQSSVSSIQTLKSPDTENRTPITDNRTPTTDALRVIAWDAAWGWPGAEPVPGDYDGNGASDLAVFDRNSGLWYIASLTSVQSSVSSIQTLKSPDTETRSPIASPRPHPPITDNRTPTTDALRVIAWGAAWGWPGAEPVPGDYDGDGASDLAVFDTASGFWYIASLTSVQSSASGIQTLKSPDTETRSPIASPHPPITDNRTPTTDALRVIAWGAAWGWPGAEPVPGAAW